MSNHAARIGDMDVDLDKDDDVEIYGDDERIWLPRRKLIAWLGTLPPLDPPLSAEEIEAYL